MSKNEGITYCSGCKCQRLEILTYGNVSFISALIQNGKKNVVQKLRTELVKPAEKVMVEHLDGK